MPNPFPLPDPFATDEHRRWVGRKEANLRRRLLDCGCPNRGEVYFHLWCDRLACQEHADALHDCGLFKGKSGSEGEAVEPEAVVEEAAPRPLTLSPETYRALYGPAEAIRHAHPLLPVRLAETWQCPRCDFSTFIGGLKRLHEVACPAPPVGELRPFFTTALDGEAEAFAGHVSAALAELVEPDPIGAQVTVMTEAEAAGFRAQQQLSLECSRSRPLCSGCDGLAMDGFPCVHDCHEPAVCSCPEVDVSTFTDRSTARRFRQGYDPGCRVHAAPSAPHVDAASELDLPVELHRYECPHSRCDWVRVALDLDVFDGLLAEHERAEHAVDPRPWWRRMLPGGTR